VESEEELGNLSKTQQTFWQRLRAVLTFLVKLFIDGTRDLLLFPAAAIAFCLDCLWLNPDRETFFEKLMRFGRGTDRAINLFNQHDAKESSLITVDDVFDRLEASLRQEYANGAIAAQAKEAMDKAVDKVRLSVNRNKSDSSAE